MQTTTLVIPWPPEIPYVPLQADSGGSDDADSDDD